ncbi:inhibitory synaptic factor 1 [Engraulis encrasicolus]|uniref:inhibitory synaptic factor 1 n=1 Tax=Engraulis encrasicolus TaxID=184585 RepID=UPI002FD56425
MKMVISQLEGILKELKDVAHELREVVGQIDKLTSDFDFELDAEQEADDWTVATASSTSSSERGLGEAFRLDFLGSHDLLSDSSWEFCNFLEASVTASAAASAAAACASTSTVPHGAGSGPGSGATVGTTTTITTGTSMSSAYSQMNGGLPIPNGPLIVTPDSSSASEEASSSTTHSTQRTSRTSGTRERVRFSDKILYHALCCDDDEDDQAEDDEEEVEVDYGEAHKGLLHPSLSRRKPVRNSSTQTVSDKSTQTLLPYIPAKHKTQTTTTTMPPTTTTTTTTTKDH